MLRTYTLNVDGARYQIDLRSSVGYLIFELYGPKFTRTGLVHSAIGTLELDDFTFRPPLPKGLPWEPLQSALRAAVPDQDRALWEKAIL